MKLKCFYCEGEKNPNFHEAEALGKFLSDRGKILPREKTGICFRHQRLLTREIKRARHLALLPFVS